MQLFGLGWGVCGPDRENSVGVDLVATVQCDKSVYISKGILTLDRSKSADDALTTVFSLKFLKFSIAWPLLLQEALVLSYMQTWYRQYVRNKLRYIYAPVNGS